MEKDELFLMLGRIEQKLDSLSTWQTKTDKDVESLKTWRSYMAGVGAVLAVLYGLILKYV